MKYKKKVQETVREHFAISRTECDGCQCDLRYGPSDRKYSGNANEVEISAKVGDYWPSGDCRQVYELDCCIKCFMEKVMPALENVGFKFRERSNDEFETDYAELDVSDKK